ncbi:hypothetical protein METESE_34600 [Mesoterricola sediminis]|uniref:Uncharacterized protein n=1 Tax=Mesoterricola sediminis TaxID=2927980 RepID=A0AA48KFP1_9BACT|nr:hypothetical protein METESE_34600 [Mesoterricola sediminis]
MKLEHLYTLHKKITVWLSICAMIEGETSFPVTGTRWTV